MVEMLVRQHNMRDRVPGKLPNVVVDCGRLGQRGTGVDEERSSTAADQPDGDVAERKPAAMHAWGQLFPDESHREQRSGLTCREFPTYSA